jgi:hypothetical protein
MFSGLAQGVSRGPEVFGARKIIGKRVVGQLEDLLST